MNQLPLILYSSLLFRLIVELVDEPPQSNNWSMVSLLVKTQACLDQARLCPRRYTARLFHQHYYQMDFYRVQVSNGLSKGASCRLNLSKPKPPSSKGFASPLQLPPCFHMVHHHHHRANFRLVIMNSTVPIPSAPSLDPIPR